MVVPRGACLVSSLLARLRLLHSGRPLCCRCAQVCHGALQSHLHSEAFVRKLSSCYEASVGVALSNTAVAA